MQCWDIDDKWIQRIEERLQRRISEKDVDEIKYWFKYANLKSIILYYWDDPIIVEKR